eukprot:m.100585 g.100585  ORF g.100585 m.100585 type:complete len:383 (+) comp9047_c6_seq1:358-1506(+)
MSDDGATSNLVNFFQQLAAKKKQPESNAPLPLKKNVTEKDIATSTPTKKSLATSSTPKAVATPNTNGTTAKSDSTQPTSTPKRGFCTAYVPPSSQRRLSLEEDDSKSLEEDSVVDEVAPTKLSASSFNTSVSLRSTAKVDKPSALQSVAPTNSIDAARNRFNPSTAANSSRTLSFTTATSSTPSKNAPPSSSTTTTPNRSKASSFYATSTSPKSTSTLSSSTSSKLSGNAFNTSPTSTPTKTSTTTPSTTTPTTTEPEKKSGWKPPAVSKDAGYILPKFVHVATPSKKDAAPEGGFRQRTATLKKKPGQTSNRCAVCDKTVYEMEKVVADGILLHKICFRCAECNTRVSTGNYAALEGVIYCKAHFKQLFQTKGRYTFNEEV